MVRFFLSLIYPGQAKESAPAPKTGLFGICTY
jgi:hypothetical protein